MSIEKISQEQVIANNGGFTLTLIFYEIGGKNELRNDCQLDKKWIF